ncbi:tautomerase family protein [Variovorax paradoxus]|uniref:tautomerase family protein n=1 Tax=Variovorax paradoxus TaxID=34073 RepID=UPI003D649613
MQAHLPEPAGTDDPGALFSAYSDCFVQALNAKPGRVRIQIVPVRANHTYVGGKTPARLCILTVFLLEGRTAAAKAELIEALAKVTMAFTSTTEDEVRVVIHDIAREDIGFGTRTAAALGF